MRSQKLPARERIDTRRGLVEEQNGWLVQHGAAQRQALFPAKRQLRRHAFPLIRETGHLQHPLASLGQTLTVYFVQAGEERDVLLHREVAIERKQLRHVADALFDLLRTRAYVETRDPTVARCRR